MRSFEVITGSHPKAAAMSTKSARAAVFACACILILPMASHQEQAGTEMG